ncbi:hypothetical protein MYCTH_2306057 [Thermothelomyces thermophilus ATCC 42464]|uniref:Uncharacterized protein n=1 Tax=Thermothelomyces thermophilus (strain ATCC 42464 / BCRC 31852 / DSM 1799) TaxID=573729 RepID=G2QGP2_THET4|nr:uncharacterized protein MYCTH_2306057 [Thermothelomyces thermophilus ATCC 42464]AEO58604.1 hypothetical protein MYCTH_2306057 [Thermothelomyces thermophilus ATCC 42464]
MHLDHPVNQSLQQIDENSWLFGGGVSAVWRVGDAICKAKKYTETLERSLLDASSPIVLWCCQISRHRQGFDCWRKRAQVQSFDPSRWDLRCS